MSRSKEPSIEERFRSFERKLKELQAGNEASIAKVKLLQASNESLTARVEVLEADVERCRLSIQAYTASRDHDRRAAAAQAARLPPRETQVSLRSASCASKAERRY